MASSLYDTLDGTVLQKPGQYYLNDVVLTSYRSQDGTNLSDKIEIGTLIADLNIFESIESKCLSGNILIVDTQNIVGKLPLTGNERLEFKLYTPSSPYTAAPTTRSETTSQLAQMSEEMTNDQSVQPNKFQVELKMKKSTKLNRWNFQA